MRETAVKYFSDYRKRIYERIYSILTRKQSNRIFMLKELATKVIMDCRTTAVHNLQHG